MRWISARPDSLGLLDGSPINCLLLEKNQWAVDLLTAARARKIVTLGVARTGAEADLALAAAVDGIVLEGDFAWQRRGSKPVIALPGRRGIRFDGHDEVIGTTQGVWPRIEVEHGGMKTTAAPTGSAWIHTNTGFLRYVRAAARSTFWMANRPPAGMELTAIRYDVALADAESTGARWVIALDDVFARNLLARQAEALAAWKRLMEHVRFYEAHRDWARLRPRADLALIQDPESGALVTGNLLDMLAVLNTPVRAVPSRELTAAMLEGTRVTVTVNPQSYTAEQRALIARFASRGGKVVSGPDGWKMPLPSGDQITFDKAQYRDLEAIWPELHMAVMRKNFGARMFNVSGTLTYLLAGEKQTLLQLVNYTDYPVESITAFVEGKYRKATLLSPGEPPKVLSIYDAPEGTGVEIEKLAVCGAVVLE
jgi:hypothetical protein